MKVLLPLLCLLSLCLLATPRQALADQGELTLYYLNDVRGEMQPCG